MKRLACALACALIVLGPASSAPAATPDRGTLTPGATVEWTGGPLSGTVLTHFVDTIAGVETVDCRPATACDDFLLDVQLPSSDDPSTFPLVRLELEASEPNEMFLLAREPGSDPSDPGADRFFRDQARLVRPKAGVWRIRVACALCAAASYKVTATGAVIKPNLPARGPLVFSNVRLPGEGRGEPGVAVGPQNEIFVNAPAGAGAIWRSFDGGDTWKHTADFDRMPPYDSFDSDLVVAPDDGAVYAADLSADAFTAWVYTSRDHGETYAGPFWGGSNVDRQWLGAGPRGNVYMLYHDLAPLGGQNMWLLRSTDYGQTFVPMSNITLGSDVYDDSSCGNLTDRPHVDPRDANIVYVFYTIDESPGCIVRSAQLQFALTQVWMAKSIDGGLNWIHSRVAGGEGEFPGLFPSGDIDEAGNIYVAYARLGAAAPETEGATETHIIMKASTDGGQSWRGPFLVDRVPQHRSNVFPALAAGRRGRVDVAWYASEAGDFNDPEAAWTVALTRAENADAPQPLFSQSRVSDKVVHVGEICHDGAFCSFTGKNRRLLDFLGVDIGPDGLANVVWADDTQDEILVVFGKEKQAAPPPGPAPTRVLGEKILAETGGGEGLAALGVMLLACAGRLRRSLREA